MRAKGLSFDPADPLALAKTDEPQGHEAKRANQALHDYCMLGTQRSVERLWDTYVQANTKNPQYKPPAKTLFLLKTYSMRYAWVERAKLWDAINRKKQEAELNAFWLEARTTIPLADYHQSEKLRELVSKTLAKLEDFIEEKEETDPKSGKTTVYKRMDLRATIEALKVASELQRRSAGMDNKTPVQANIDLNKLPNEYLDRIINGEPLEQVWADYRNATSIDPGSDQGPGPQDQASSGN